MSKRDQSSANPSTYITQVRQGSVISGNMKSENSIRVDGYVTGDLVSDERIIIGNHGEIGGNLSGMEITIEGYVNGDVIAKGLLHLAQTARVFGKIYAKHISVDNGAEMNGKINVGEKIEVPELNSSSPSRSNKQEAVEKPLPEKRKTNVFIPNTKVDDEDKTDNYGSVAW
ncbi:bactofilin family protein [Roseivirga sp.]|uniref:bactofilin family protein n=1 Tax=Roseivirga sp. TaxID=1964215 RepID=UPI003B8E5870